MTHEINSWAQSGRIYFWRYGRYGERYGSWHFSGDPDGCCSLRDLLDRMAGGSHSFRTWKLSEVPENAWRVPGHGPPASRDKFERLRIEFDPDRQGMELLAQGDALRLLIGNSKLEDLKAALSKVEKGGGDFAIRPDARRKDESWLFWWLIR